MKIEAGNGHAYEFLRDGEPLAEDDELEAVFALCAHRGFNNNVCIVNERGQGDEVVVAFLFTEEARLAEQFAELLGNVVSLMRLPFRVETYIRRPDN